MHRQGQMSHVLTTVLCLWTRIPPNSALWRQEDGPVIIAVRTDSCHLNTHPLSLGGRWYHCAHLEWRKWKHKLLSNLFKFPQQPVVGQVDYGHLASESLLSGASAPTGEPDTWKVSKLWETINGSSLNKSRKRITSVNPALNNYELLSTECWAFPVFIKETL